VLRNQGPWFSASRDHADTLQQLERERGQYLPPEALARALDAEPDAMRIAADQAGLDRAVVLGRGFGYATAREWSLKLKEVAQLWADPYSAADFAHGPVALLAPGSAVFASIVAGPARDALLDPVRALVRDVGADVMVLSDDAEAQAVARWVLPVPAGLAEWLSPIAAIVPAQLHAMHLSVARGLDPEQPRGAMRPLDASVRLGSGRLM